MTALSAQEIEDNSKRLVRAVVGCDIPKVQQLIPLSDLHYNNCEPLLWAAWYGYQECIDLLFEGSDVNSVIEQLDHMVSSHNLATSQDYLRQRQQAVEQQHLLHQELADHVIAGRAVRKL